MNPIVWSIIIHLALTGHSGKVHDLPLAIGPHVAFAEKWQCDEEKKRLRNAGVTDPIECRPIAVVGLGVKRI